MHFMPGRRLELVEEMLDGDGDEVKDEFMVLYACAGYKAGLEGPEKRALQGQWDKSSGTYHDQYSADRTTLGTSVVDF